MNKSRETFHFKPLISTEGFWMIGLTSLEVYNSILNITEENTKFEIHTDTFDELSFVELKSELEAFVNHPGLTAEDLEDELLGPRSFQTCRKLRLEKSNTDGYTILLAGYTLSSFRDFKSYLRILVGLDEDDVQLTLKQHNSHFITYKLPQVKT